MASRRGPFRNLLEALLVAGALGPIALLPRRAGLAVMGGLGRAMSLVMPGRRARARRRVERTLGCSRREADRIVRGAFATMAMNLVEAHWVTRDLDRGGIESLVTVEGAEHVREAMAAGRGVLLAAGHMGAWEAHAVVMGRVFKPIWAVARPLDNPWLGWLTEHRRGGEMAGSLDKHGSVREIMKLIRQGELVGLLLDQNAGASGVMLPFLGLPARTHRIAGVLGARLGAVVVPTYLLREPDGRYRLIVEAPVTAPEGCDRETAEAEITWRVSRSLERQVLAHPEQWLWLHDRWHSAEVVLFLERRDRARAKSRPVPEGPEGTNGR